MNINVAFEEADQGNERQIEQRKFPQENSVMETYSALTQDLGSLN